MACLSSTVLTCTVYSTVHRQQRRRRSIASCAISILYLATLATLSHTENKESSDVLLLFIRKYIYQRYLRQLCPLQCSGGPHTFESTWGLRVGGGVALCSVRGGAGVWGSNVKSHVVWMSARNHVHCRSLSSEVPETFLSDSPILSNDSFHCAGVLKRQTGVLGWAGLAEKTWQ